MSLLTFRARLYNSDIESIIGNPSKTKLIGEITVKINVADRAQIYPPAMRALFDDHQQKNQQIGNKTNDMRDIYSSTSNFWIGSSADKTRSSFESKIVPQFEDLLSVLQQIVSLGLDWVEDAVKFEASLGV